MSKRRATLPGVARDIEALLGDDGGERPEATAAPPVGPRPAAIPQVDPRAAVPSTVAPPDRMTAAPEPHAAIDRAALARLAEQFPSADPARTRAAVKDTHEDPAGAAAGGTSAGGTSAGGPSAGSATASGATESGARAGAPPTPEPEPHPSSPPAGAARPSEPGPQPGGVSGAAARSLDSALFGDDPRRRWAVLAGLAVAALAVAVLLESMILSTPGSGQPSAAAVVTAQAPAPAGGNGVTALGARVDALQQRIDGVAAAVEAQGRTLAALPAPGGAPDILRAERAAVLALRLDMLARAGRPFAAELAAIRAATGAEEALDTPLARLEPFAENGVATGEDLAAQLGVLWPRITAQRPAAPAPGLVERVGTLLGRQSAADTVTAAILARARSEAESGALAAAVRQLQRLTGDQAIAAQPWIVLAERRIALDAALRDLIASAFRAAARDG